MDTKPSVITISYGRQLFDRSNNEFERHRKIASVLKQLDMVVFTLRTDGFEVLHAENNFIVHPTNSRYKLFMPFDAVRIASAIIRNSKETPIVTTQDPATAGLVGWWLKRTYGVRLVVQEHCDILSTNYWRHESFKNRIEYFISIFVLRRADIIRTVAKRIEAAVRKVGATAPITQLPVAIDVVPFLEARTVRPHNRDIFELVSVARFVKQKNLPMLIRAFAAAHTINPKLRLKLVGRGPEEDTVRAEIAKQFPPARYATPLITVLPWSDNVPTLLTQADAYVLSSNYEGWGRVLIEAAAAELPIITTDVGCVGEVLVHNQHAVVVPINNQTALKDAMLEIANNPELYSRLIREQHLLLERGVPGTGIDEYAVAWRNTLDDIARSE